MGPTSSGKSALAVSLARKFQGEVISADSRQVYRGLNIGTGKITKREMRGIPHHLLDVASPAKMFTVHDFAAQAREAISDIAGRGKVPIIAGGTGLYVDVLTGRITLPDVPVNLKLRARLAKKTAVELCAMLERRDPRRAQTIDRHNPRRLIRALEVVAALGKVPLTKDRPLYDAVWLGIAPELRELQAKIRNRLAARIRGGMVAEAKKLYAGGLSYKRMEELGLEYRSLARLLQKKTPRAAFERELNRDILRYAKRQMAYWKRNKDIRWFNPSEKKSIASAVQRWLVR